jgi:hypothetical protein
MLALKLKMQPIVASSNHRIGAEEKNEASKRLINLS